MDLEGIMEAKLEPFADEDYEPRKIDGRMTLWLHGYPDRKQVEADKIPKIYKAMRKGYDVNIQDAVIDGDLYMSEAELPIDGDGFRYIDGAFSMAQSDINGTISLELERFRFKQHTTFRGVRFKQKADFSLACFMQGVDFTAARFEREVHFDRARFRQVANFYVVHFEKVADFSDCRFRQFANFRDARFKQRVTFVKARFKQDADFGDACFKQEADFVGACFRQKADFTTADFEQVAFFREVTFGEAVFDRTSLKKDTSFVKATFKRVANFRRAEFGKPGYFGDVKICENTVGRGLWKYILYPLFWWLWPVIWFFTIGKVYLRETSVTDVYRINTNTVMDTSTNPRLKRYIDDEQWVESWRKNPKGRWWRESVFRLWELTSHCGRSIGLWAFWSFFLAFLFTIAYTPAPDWMGEKWCNFWQEHGAEFEQMTEAYKGSPVTFWSCLYFSIVSFTTLGFGDIATANWQARFLVTLEVILGYVMLGGLISIFANKFARRS